MTIRPIESSFIAGADTVSSLPASDAPEVAFIGRSNVGKSTLINRLTNRKHLARVSNTPGRTKQANLFTVKYRSEGRSDGSITLVDLPGFGYAKVGKAAKDRFSDLIVDYLTVRKQLAALFLLNDIRRDPQDEEIALRDMAFEVNIPLIILTTKCDKVSKGERAKRLAILAKNYQLAPHDIILTGEKMPLDMVWERLILALESREIDEDKEESD